MKTDFSRWKDEDEEDETEGSYNDDNLNSVRFDYTSLYVCMYCVLSLLFFFS